MQYILTEEELLALKTQQRSIQLENTAKLQTLCSKIADEMPVPRPWTRGSATPWGCIYTESGNNFRGYCDLCPVTEICPGKKRYSK